MKLIFLLSKQDIELACAEIEELFNAKTKKESRSQDNIVSAAISEDDVGLLPRLAYTKQASELLFSCTEKELEKKISSFEFTFKGSFAVEIIGSAEKNASISGKKVGSMIWKRLEKQKKKPKVNLENPDALFDVIVCNEPGKLFFCRSLFSNEHEFEKRKAHKRPVLHPSSMHPKLARCLVNLSGARKEILDPLCGSGGILIEAGLAGLKIIGVDFDKKLLEGAEENLEGYTILGYRLIEWDAKKIRQIIPETEAIVTDFPYGLHSKAPKKLEKFYLELLSEFYKMAGRAVVVMPDFVDGKKLIAKTKWKIKRKFSYYVHKSLTRMVFVLEHI